LRIRSVKPEFFTDRISGRWPLDTMAFYVALWCLADDDGRFEWEPEAIRGRLFPFKPDLDVAAYLNQLESAGKVQRYTVDGLSYGLIPSFTKHQKPNRKVKSKLPPPPSTIGSLPSHDQLTPVVEGRVEEGSSEAPPTVDRTRPLSLRLEAAFLELRGAKYAHGGAKDTVALKRMLGWAEEDEIERRWRASLATQGFHRCDSYTQLSMSQHWNFFASSVIPFNRVSYST
jgi:hypothetical protein